MLQALLTDADAVLFDFDGVLVDSEPFYFRSYQKAFRKRGHELREDEYWRHWTSLGEGIAGEVERHGLGFGPDEIAAIAHEQRGEYDRFCSSGEIPFFPGMLEALRELSAFGMPCAVASSSREESIEAIFRASVGSGPPCPLVGRRAGLRPKPWSDIYVYAAGVLGVPPAACVVVEDAEKGVAAARAVDMRSVVVRNALNRSFSFRKADAVVDSHEVFLQEVRSWIERSGGV